jgi:RNA polymerase sigma-70 factor (ECF subfamily)
LIDLEQAAEAVSAGDPSAFSRIVLATQVRFVRMSARILGGVAEAEEVVQDAYLKAYRALVARQFDGRSTVATWLYRIVLNGTLDARRARRRAPTASGRAAPNEQDIAATDGVWDGAESTEARVALSELSTWLGGLPEDQQAVLVLKAVEGFSATEIAEILRCSEGAVEQRLVRARAASTARGRDGPAAGLRFVSRQAPPGPAVRPGQPPRPATPSPGRGFAR